MGDVLTQSPEATYATKGNIIPQDAYVGNRTAGDIADGPGIPNAEGTVEDHLTKTPYLEPGGAAAPTITTGSFTTQTPE